MSEHFVYVLFSRSANKFYHGRSNNIQDRLTAHNSGKVKSTKNGIPWEIIYTEKLPDLDSAIVREKFFKTAAGRRFLDPIKQKYKS
jgi:putative endonuclease